MTHSVSTQSKALGPSLSEGQNRTLSSYTLACYSARPDAQRAMTLEGPWREDPPDKGLSVVKDFLDYGQSKKLSTSN